VDAAAFRHDQFCVQSAVRFEFWSRHSVTNALVNPQTAIN